MPITNAEIYADAEADFWRHLGPVTARERDALIEERLPSQYVNDRAAIAQVTISQGEDWRDSHMVRDVRAVREIEEYEAAATATLDAAYWFLRGMGPHAHPPKGRNRRAGLGEGLSRTELLHDLGEVLSQAEHCPAPVPPVEVVVLDADGGPPLQARRIQVTFDSYLTQGDVFAVVAPKMRRARPLGQRKATLLRFVCLDHRDQLHTWVERVGHWDRKYPEWAYGSERAMWSDFNRAWKSLVGDDTEARKWFKWFTDAECREEVNRNDHT